MCFTFQREDSKQTEEHNLGLSVETRNPKQDQGLRRANVLSLPQFCFCLPALISVSSWKAFKLRCSCLRTVLHDVNCRIVHSNSQFCMYAAFSLAVPLCDVTHKRSSCCRHQIACFKVSEELQTPPPFTAKF